MYFQQRAFSLNETVWLKSFQYCVIYAHPVFQQLMKTCIECQLNISLFDVSILMISLFP